MTVEYQDKEPSRAEVDQMKGPTVLDFGNAWCGYCMRTKPLVDAALRAHPGVRHIRIADASGKRLGRSFRVKLWPTLVFLDDGAEVARLVRPDDRADVDEALSRINGRGRRDDADP